MSFNNGKPKREVSSNSVLVIGLLVIILVVFFLESDFEFSGSLLVSCQNFEPRTFDQYASTFQSMGGSMTRVDSFIIPIGADLEKYDMYKSRSYLGVIHLIPMEIRGCNDFLVRVYENPYHADNTLNLGRENVLCVTGYAIINNMCVYNYCWSAQENITVYDTLKECNDAVGHTTTNFLNLERRQILNTPAGYMFCNYENNMVLIAPSVNELSRYVSKFEVCNHPKKEPVIDPDNDVVEPSLPDLDQPSPSIPGGEGSVEPSGFVAGFNAKVFNTVLLVLLVGLIGLLIYRRQVHKKWRK